MASSVVQGAKVKAFGIGLEDTDRGDHLKETMEVVGTMTRMWCRSHDLLEDSLIGQ